MAAQEIALLGYPTKMLNGVAVAKATMALPFRKPSGFDFESGQAAELTFLNPPEPDPKGDTRTFSIASGSV